MSVTGEFHRHLEMLCRALRDQGRGETDRLAERLECIVDDVRLDLSAQARRTREELAATSELLASGETALAERAEMLGEIARIILGE